MFDEAIERYQAQMIETWQELIRIPSVHSPGLPGAPGPSTTIRKALQYVLDWAIARGFHVYDGGAYGYVQYGQGSRRMDVVSHVDVYPVEGAWTHQPFDPVVVDGILYGRGALDNKGPLLSTLWALVVLRNAMTVPADTALRVVVLTDVESTGHSATQYLADCGEPSGGFSTDGVFGPNRVDFGTAVLRLGYRTDLHSMLPTVVHLECGSPSPTVPNHAYAVIECHSDTAAREWSDRLSEQGEPADWTMDLSLHGSRIQLAVHGQPIHAANPVFSANAIERMLTLLAQFNLTNSNMWRFLAGPISEFMKLYDASESEACQSTLVFAGLHEDAYAFLFDIRYARDADLADLFQTVSRALSDRWTFEILWNRSSSPDPSRELASTEKRQQTSDVVLVRPWIHWTGHVPNTVPFGPIRPGEPLTAHAIDEHWSIASYLDSIRIYAQAMLEWTTR